LNATLMTMLSLSVTLLTCHVATAADLVSLARQGNALLGKDKSDAERCQECHGVDGHGQRHPNGPEGKFAKLAGQHPEYLLKQLADFRSGARKNDQMAIMARTVADEDLADIVAYFSSQKPMRGEGGVSDAIGRKLYTQGDAGRGIPACATCHGEAGQGTEGMAAIPRVGGQEWLYLERQLLDWRSGERKNSPGGLMNQAVKGLTDSEIQALANYLAAQ
jgi:cytochrome c553